MVLPTPIAPVHHHPSPTPRSHHHQPLQHYTPSTYNFGYQVYDVNSYVSAYKIANDLVLRGGPLVWWVKGSQRRHNDLRNMI